MLGPPEVGLPHGPHTCQALVACLEQHSHVIRPQQARLLPLALALDLATAAVAADTGPGATGAGAAAGALGGCRRWLKLGPCWLQGWVSGGAVLHITLMHIDVD